MVGGNLFALAAAELGDALQWVNLAQENALSDPFLTGTAVIRIPSPNKAFADGIGAQ
ncbi:MAG TPA: hypothetical protein PLD10_21575 [Rhodopila sp.]|nr:hypothetical protein [Rhodopila sp.]